VTTANDGRTSDTGCNPLTHSYQRPLNHNTLPSVVPMKAISGRPAPALLRNLKSGMAL
jgi:hypothetical protein